MCNNNTYILKLPACTFFMVCNQNSVQTAGWKGRAAALGRAVFIWRPVCATVSQSQGRGARSQRLGHGALGYFGGHPKQEHHLELNLKLCEFFRIIRIICIPCS